MSVIDTLITDRVTGAKYNASDLNRVGEAVTYVAGRLTAAGIAVTVSPRTDWARTEPVLGMLEAINAYRADIRTLRAKLAVLPTTPAAPGDTAYMTVADSNAIEQILTDLNINLTRMARVAPRCGAAVCGEV